MILILGDGLLGTWVHILYPKDTILLGRKDVDITDSWRVGEMLHNIHPDAVINAAGLTNKRNPNPEDRYHTNALAPHRIAEACDMYDAKLVQVSTDCVFLGDKGSYSEMDEPDNGDNYSWTKWQGEVTESPHLTVRASFVGFPDAKGLGLLHWLYSMLGRPVEGYRGVAWNGLTTWAFANYLVEAAYSKATGIRHVFGQMTDKYTVLETANRVFNWGARIVPVDEPVSNRTLKSNYTDSLIGSGGFNLEESMREMAKWERKMYQFLTTKE